MPAGSPASVESQHVASPPSSAVHCGFVEQRQKPRLQPRPPQLTPHTPQCEPLLSGSMQLPEQHMLLPVPQSVPSGRRTARHDPVAHSPLVHALLSPSVQAVPSRTLKRVHSPPLHVSARHPVRVPHAVPFEAFTARHAPAMQVKVRHWVFVPHEVPVCGVPAQPVAVQTSPLVHGLPSLHALPITPHGPAASGGSGASGGSTHASGTPASGVGAPGIGSQPKRPQYSPSAHAPSIGTLKQAPARHVAVAHGGGSEHASGSPSAQGPGSSHDSPGVRSQRGETQRPFTHAVSSGSSPSGHSRSAQRAPSTTRTTREASIETSTLRSIKIGPPSIGRPGAAGSRAITRTV